MPGPWARQDGADLRLLPPPPGDALLPHPAQASNVTVDCAGSTLHGLSQGQSVRPPYNGNLTQLPFAQYPEGHDPEWEAILVKGYEPELSEAELKNPDLISTLEQGALKNILVKNCQIQDYKYGVSLHYKLQTLTVIRLRQYQHITGSFIENVEDRLRASAPRNIAFHNVHIRGAHASGMYIHSYIHHVTFSHGSIHDAGALGIYLDSGTRDNSVLYSTFEGNGHYFWKNDLRVRTLRTGKEKREAIAVDASAQNIIRGNHFKKNAAGGVFLYKNCFEQHTEPNQIPRFQHSRDNLIESNTFEQENVGLWIASRQSRDLRNWGCGDPLVYSEGWPIKHKYYRDYAERTTAHGNLFESNATGIRVEDDHATITSNTFDGNTSAGLSIGSRIKLKTKKPVRETTVKDNVFLTPSSHSIVNRYGSLDGVFKRNKKGNGTNYWAPCAAPFYVAAFDAPGKSCRMEKPVVPIYPFPYDPAAVSYLHDNVYSFRDTTNEGYAYGVWGQGEFRCLNGGWYLVDGYCCYGTSCS